MPMPKIVIENFRMNVGVLKTTLDKTPDSIRLTPPADGVQPLAWQLGHIVYSIAGAAGILGRQVELGDDYAGKYGMGTTPPADPADYTPAATMLNDLDAAVAATLEAAESVDDARLAEPEPHESMQKAGITTIGSMATFLMTGHLAYHVGQLAAVRRVQGQPPALGF